MIRKLPLGISSFKQLRAESIFVDKTDLIPLLFEYPAPMYFTRPGHFGRTTLIDTIETLYNEGLSAFEGLKITTSPFLDNLCLENKHYVLRLDFAEIKRSDAKYFSHDFYEYIKDKIRALNYDSYDETSYDVIMTTIKRSKLDTILLIDNYDAPLLQVLDDKDELKRRGKCLEGFFQVVKALAGEVKIELTLIMGRTRYLLTELIDAPNSLLNLTQDDKVANLLGFSQEDLEYYFKDHIAQAATVLNNTFNSHDYTYEKVLDLIKKHYYAHSFDYFVEFKVYDPYQILNFLDKPQHGFLNYRKDEYTPLLRSYIKACLEDYHCIDHINPNHTVYLQFFEKK